ncbi:MAG: YggS family pyridoxal phosphate enzyme [Candidatus Fischerbacteria bacterium RBG_13_37_8]|uniref:Pyridoxal phosphate homeostasis protein n=1 Tax=Candidatus Fischerbacteria bacterium RBG_13_37_8 TaxID=1817863 RepID=A0A1F5VP27_9BACT|nr:MAG: YggS family pyridoxal phosphate enzyme [Candidatus Fischerbacteria bacterium RBG_13_37_8]
MNMRQQTIVENISYIQNHISKICSKTGRDVFSVKLMAVSKTMPADDIVIAIEAGVKIVGENIVQEASEKFRIIKPVLEEHGVRLHFIGHLQSNKVRMAMDVFDSIDTIDRLKIAHKLQENGEAENKVIDCMIQINIGSENSKFGISDSELKNLIAAAAQMKNLRIKGLFAVPPYFEDPESVRPYLQKMRLLQKDLQKAFPHFDLNELSMGMSHDYSVAIEEGATIIRVGQGIFGPRFMRK